MPRALAPFLFGSDGFRRYLDVLLVLAVFAATFAAYALGIFAVTGGVVFLAADAALVGVLAAAVVGYQGSGLAFGWLVADAALLGQRADHYLLGLSGRPASARLAALFRPDGLAFLAVEALVLGTLAWGVGALCRWATRRRAADDA